MARGSTARGVSSKSYASDAGVRALDEHLARQHRDASAAVRDGRPTAYHVQHHVAHDAMASLIIPFKDQPNLLENCVNSIRSVTSFLQYEIVLISNNSVEDATYQFLQSLRGSSNIRVLEYNKPFNYSAINNFGRTQARGNTLVFVNNDTQAFHPDWLSELVGVSHRPDVGAVGAMLLYPRRAIQHAGVVLGMTGMAGHVFRNLHPGQDTVFGNPEWPRNYLAVTGACLAVQADRFDQVNGFDEHLIVCGSDVKLGLDLHGAGYTNVYWPFAKMYHLESQSVGSYANCPPSDFELCRKYYARYLHQGDPYYSPRLDLRFERPRLEERAAP